MQEKNAVPTVDKKAYEDSNNMPYDRIDADIGQTVTFQAEINIKNGAEKYVFHDKMSAGLTFSGADSVEVKIKRTNSQVEEVVAASNYTVVTEGLEDGCTFHVEFAQSFQDTFISNDMLYVYYSAELNENAVIGGDDETGGNANEAWLNYGDENFTTPDIAKVYTWEMDIFKYAEGTNEAEIPLSGAEFVLKTVFHADEPTQYAVIENGKLIGWTMNMDYPEESGKADIILDKNNNHILDTEESGEVNGEPIFATIMRTYEDGMIEIDGLDGYTTYSLEEVKAPAGYNLLADDVVISMDNRGQIEGTTDGKTVKVLNHAGSELPTTGGMGTTIFYVVGSVLMVGAAVLLITKRRMSKNA